MLREHISNFTQKYHVFTLYTWNTQVLIKMSWSCNIYSYNWDFLFTKSGKLSIHLSRLRLWYPELASIIDMYLTPVSFDNISFSVGPLCIGLISI